MFANISDHIATRLDSMAEVSAIKHTRRVAYAKQETAVRMAEDREHFAARLVDLANDRARMLANASNADHYMKANEILDTALGIKIPSKTTEA